MPCTCYSTQLAFCRCRLPKTSYSTRPIDLRTDRPLRTLNDVHHAGAEGLASIFPVGSIWEVGPFSEANDPVVVRITGVPQVNGVNYACQPGAECAKGEPCWFMPTETLYTPYKRRVVEDGALEGQPPHVLGALTPRMAAKIELPCWEDDDILSDTALIASLRKALQERDARITNMATDLAQHAKSAKVLREELSRAQNRLVRVQRALTV